MVWERELHSLALGRLELLTVIYVDVSTMSSEARQQGCSLVTSLAQVKSLETKLSESKSQNITLTSESCTGETSHRPSLQLADFELNACSLGCQGHIACLLFTSEFAAESDPFHQATFTYIRYSLNQEQIHRRTFLHCQS